MARKRARPHARTSYISPLSPAIHFILFLVLAFILVVIVGVVMQQSAASTRAALMCPQSKVDQAKLIEELSARCPSGVEYTKDANGCQVWVCKLPPQVIPSTSPFSR
jgi:hypothetical protein